MDKQTFIDSIIADLPISTTADFGPLEILIIAAAISTAVSWLVEKCLDTIWPNNSSLVGIGHLSYHQKSKLSRLIRWSIYKSVDGSPEANKMPVKYRHMFAQDLYETHLHSIREAILKKGGQLSFSQINSLKLEAGNAGKIFESTCANVDMLPEDA